MRSSSNLDVSAAGADDGALPSDDTLYDRMLANLLGCWTRIAEGTDGSLDRAGPRRRGRRVSGGA